MKYFNTIILTKEASPNGNSKEESCKEKSSSKEKSCKEKSSSKEKSSKKEIKKF